MSLDDKIQHAQQRELPWDDLRERRVLAELRRKRDAGYVVDDDAPRRVPRLLLGAGMMTTAAAVVLTILGTGQLEPRNSVRDQIVAVAPEAHPAETRAVPTDATAKSDPATEPQPDFASRMQLSDGSVVALAAGAEVTVHEQSDALIALRQSEGRAHYEVVPELPRRFEVVAAGVKVEVVGTRFDIEVSDTQVAVFVEHGKVEVAAGDRVAELGAGDQLQIKRPVAVEAETPDRADETGTDIAAPTAKAARVPSANHLLDRVDAARARGDQREAASLLRTLLAEHPRDPRAASAWFTLGRVEKSRGRLRDAARAFARAHDEAPAGPLAEDALAESAKAWARAGAHAQAQRAASRYLDRYAQGTHRARMAKIAAE